MPRFDKKDYESSDGFLTSVFGPIIWTHLHLISFNYPVHPTKEDKATYKQMLLYTGNTLPCRACRENFPNNLIKTGFNDKVFNNRDSFSKYVYKLHNYVNKMLGKSCELTYNDVRDRFENFRARCINGVPTIKKHKETGCIDALYGKKAKCVINMIPNEHKSESFIVDEKCVVTHKKSKLRSKSKK